MTPQGEVFDNSMARDLAKRAPGLMIVAGRYEGIDERVRSMVDQEISIGDYVLSGGEIPAMAVIEAVGRMIPGVLGNPESLDEESFAGRDARVSAIHAARGVPRDDGAGNPAERRPRQDSRVARGRSKTAHRAAASRPARAAQVLIVSDLFVALIHHPVVNRNAETVTSAITSLDIHDIARASRTYDVRGVFIVHPIPEQRKFAASVIDHWRFDFGRAHDSRRREALERVQIVAELDDAIAEASRISGARPLIVHTSARTEGGTSYAGLRVRLEAPDAPPMMILLGTGFGMSPEVAERADIVLAPILGPGDYNHLSVRSAAGIILDRLRGK